MLTETQFREAVKARIRLVNAAISDVMGIHKSEIAQRLNVRPSAVTNWESSNNVNLPDPYRTYLYCTVFSVSLDWLYKGDLAKMPHDLASSIQKIQRARASQGMIQQAQSS